MGIVDVCRHLLATRISVTNEDDGLENTKAATNEELKHTYVHRVPYKKAFREYRNIFNFTWARLLLEIKTLKLWLITAYS